MRWSGTARSRPPPLGLTARGQAPVEPRSGRRRRVIVGALVALALGFLAYWVPLGFSVWSPLFTEELTGFQLARPPFWMAPFFEVFLIGLVLLTGLLACRLSGIASLWIVAASVGVGTIVGLGSAGALLAVGRKVMPHLPPDTPLAVGLLLMSAVPLGATVVGFFQGTAVAAACLIVTHRRARTGAAGVHRRAVVAGLVVGGVVATLAGLVGAATGDGGPLLLPSALCLGAVGFVAAFGVTDVLMTLRDWRKAGCAGRPWLRPLLSVCGAGLVVGAALTQRDALERAYYGWCFGRLHPDQGATDLATRLLWLGNRGRRVLVVALTSERQDVRRAAAEALASTGDVLPGSREQLLDLLSSPDDQVREVVLGNLLTSGNRLELASHLRRMLADPSPALRRTAVDGLRRLEDRGSVPRLKDLLADPSAAVRVSAITSVAQSEALHAVPEVRTALGDPDPQVRAAAADALAALGDRISIPELRGLAADPDADVRWSALSALVRLGAADLPAIFASGLRDPEPRVRCQTIRLLASVGGDEVGPALAGLVRDPDASVRRVVLEVLPGIAGGRHVPDLAPLLDDPDVSIRRHAAMVLEDLDDPRVVARLLEAIRLRHDVDRVVETLREIVREARALPPNLVPILLDVLPDAPRPGVLLSLFRLVPDRRVVAGLVEALHEDWARGQAMPIHRTLVSLTGHDPHPEWWRENPGRRHTKEILTYWQRWWEGDLMAPWRSEGGNAAADPDQLVLTGSVHGADAGPPGRLTLDLVSGSRDGVRLQLQRNVPPHTPLGAGRFAGAWSSAGGSEGTPTSHVEGTRLDLELDGGATYRRGRGRQERTASSGESKHVSDEVVGPYTGEWRVLTGGGIELVLAVPRRSPFP